MISRRAFLATVAGGLLAAPLVAEAQPAAKVYRIGLFHVGLDHVPPSLGGLREGLKALGWEEGRNLLLDWRNLPDEEAARETAKEFARQRVDLIVAFESQTVRAAKAATAEIPIVFLHVTDPIADGFVKSLAHPGGNLTGIGEFFGELTAKKLELLKTMVPGLRRLLVLVAADDPMTRLELREVRGATAALKIQSVEREVRDREDLERVFGTLKRGEVQGVFIASSTLVTKFPSLVLRLATERQLPVPFHPKEWVTQGALFSYGANFPAVGREAAGYVDRILYGTPPPDLPVQQITQVEFVINLKTAKALGVTIPQSLLLRADHLIE